MAQETWTDLAHTVTEKEKRPVTDRRWIGDLLTDTEWSGEGRQIVDVNETAIELQTDTDH